jgi:predicted enzyme related to lactoylglutathione lyase
VAVTGIAFTVYPVADVDRAVAFYRDVLGLTVSHEIPQRYAEFAIGDAAFSVAGPEMSTAAPGSAHALALEVDDIDAEITRLAEANVPTDAKFETTVCFLARVHDVDGNTVILHQSKSRGMSGLA